MPDVRSIRCHRCDCYLGEIRDAKLKRGMAFICTECASAIKKVKPNSQSSPDSTLDGLKKMFGMS